MLAAGARHAPCRARRSPLLRTVLSLAKITMMMVMMMMMINDDGDDDDDDDDDGQGPELKTRARN